MQACIQLVAVRNVAAHPLELENEQGCDCNQYCSKRKFAFLQIEEICDF